jgi:hypothetical protein
MIGVVMVDEVEDMAVVSNFYVFDPIKQRLRTRHSRFVKKWQQLRSLLVYFFVFARRVNNPD